MEVFFIYLFIHLCISPNFFVVVVSEFLTSLHSCTLIVNNLLLSTLICCQGDTVNCIAAYHTREL